MPTPDRFREDYDPEPDYDKPTKADFDVEPNWVEVKRVDEYDRPIKKWSNQKGKWKPPAEDTNPALVRRLKKAAGRVGTERPDLHALLMAAAQRIAKLDHDIKK